MSAETFEQMALRVADEQSILWREGCAFESGIVAYEAIAFAAAIRDELAKGAEPVAYIVRDDEGEQLMYPAAIFKYKMASEDDIICDLYTFPPSAAARIAELEKQLNELNIEFNQCSSVLDGAERRAETLEKQRDDLLAVLDQAANGQHLDDVPNHDDDSLRSIAYHLPDNGWGRNALLRHAERTDAAIASVKGGAA